jgi:hypothetical protein
MANTRLARERAVLWGEREIVCYLIYRVDIRQTDLNAMLQLFFNIDGAGEIFIVLSGSN